MSERFAPDPIGDNLVAASGRSALVWVEGPDTISYLDGLLSQNIAAVDVGATARSLLLAPNGKLRATLFVLRDKERVGLVCDAGRSEIVVSDLLRFKIRVDVAIAVDTRTVSEIWGRHAADAVDYVPDHGRWAARDGILRFRMPLPHPGVQRVVVVGAEPEVSHAEPDGFEALRIELGQPVMGVDLTEKTIPQEGLDVAPYVDFAKGCYLGQELVARIDSRGHVNWRLRGITLDGPGIPASGTAVVAGDREIGVITSAAWSTRLRSVVALAMLRADVADGQEIVAGSANGTVVATPMSG